MKMIAITLGLSAGLMSLAAGAALALPTAPASQMTQGAVQVAPEAAAPIRVAPFTRTNRHEPPVLTPEKPLRVAPFTKTNRFEPPVITPAEQPIRVAPFSQTNLMGCTLVPQDSVSVKPGLGCL